MQHFPRILATALLLAPGWALAQTTDPLDELLIIPRPGAPMPTMVPENVPQVADPFMGQDPTNLDAPLWGDPVGQPQAPTTHGLGIGGQALAQPPEEVPFFEFTDEVQPQPAQPTVGTPHLNVEGPDLIASQGQALWPGQVLTPADEEPPTLGSNAIGDLLEPGSGLGPEPAAQPAPDAAFSFQDGPVRAPNPQGPVLAVPPQAITLGYHAVGGGADAEWGAQAQSQGVVRVDLPGGQGNIVLALSSETPVFWGITAPQGTHIVGVLLYGPHAAHSSIGAKTIAKERANVVRRPDVDRTGAESLLRMGGATTVEWR